MTFARLRVVAVLAGIVATLAMALEAHHSNVTFYDFDKQVEISGTVVQLRLINPHINLRVEATAANGEKVLWVIDGPNATVSRQNGWRPDVLKAGEKVKVVGHPARNPDFPGMYGEKVFKADGKVLDFGGSNTN